MTKLQDEIKKLPFELSDIEKYVRHHETNHNGTFIVALAKKELCDEWNYTYTQKTREGKYPIKSAWKILGKDYPKFRAFLVKMLTQKENFKSTTSGINAGTPIAMRYTYNRYELDGEAVKNELK